MVTDGPTELFQQRFTLRRLGQNRGELQLLIDEVKGHGNAVVVRRQHAGDARFQHVGRAEDGLAPCQGDADEQAVTRLQRNRPVKLEQRSVSGEIPGRSGQVPSDSWNVQLAGSFEVQPFKCSAFTPGHQSLFSGRADSWTLPDPSGYRRAGQRTLAGPQALGRDLAVFARPAGDYAPAMPIAVQAPAKLNLALAVGPPDERGMHPICSWMVTVSLSDDLEVTRLGESRLSRYSILWHADARRRRKIDWPVTRDLTVRAHLALEQHVGRRLPVQMKLEKRIPVGGGLGGGSSDAAAMLHAVNALFELGLADDVLLGIAAGLGSDVPFFVGGGSALVHGFGEQVEPLDRLAELHAVLVLPDSVCPTGQVYAAFDELAGLMALRTDDVVVLARSGAAPRPDSVFNDLAAAAIHVVPELGEHLRRLGELAERPAHVAGSGSSLFVLCDDRLHASHLAESVEQRLGLPALGVRGPQRLLCVQS